MPTAEPIELNFKIANLSQGRVAEALRGLGAGIFSGPLHEGSDGVLYKKLEMYSVSAEGQIERRTNDMPAVIAWPPVSVTIPKGTDHRLACRLLRQLADQLSEQEVRKASASPSKQKPKQ